MELTKQDINELFKNSVLDSNGNIDNNKIASLNPTLLHSLAETFNRLYKTPYTSEEFAKKLMTDFNVSITPIITLSTTSKGNVYKCYKASYLLFDEKYKLPLTRYSTLKGGKLLVDGKSNVNNMVYNQMNLMDLVFTSPLGFCYDMKTKQSTRVNLKPFKHQPATCCVAPSGCLRVNKDGKGLTSRDAQGNTPLTLEDIYAFVVTDVIERMDMESKQALVKGINDIPLMTSYGQPFTSKDWKQFFNDTKVLVENDFNDISPVYSNKELKYFKGVSLFLVREASFDIKRYDKVDDNTEFVYCTEFTVEGKKYIAYYNKHIFDERVNSAITIQDYVYLRDILLRTLSFLYIRETVNREVIYQGKVNKTTVYKPANLADEQQNVKLFGILRDYTLVTPLIKKVEFSDEVDARFYYQVV